MKIALAGRNADLGNYIRYVESVSLEPVPTLRMGDVARCDGLILPGGGDITPAFFGERNNGSRNIDTELDILQLQAFELAMRGSMPVLGICKGMQIINVGLGGTLIQDMPPASCAIHRYENGDKYHDSVIEKGTCLHTLYGTEAVINSAHHQSIKQLGEGLRAIQWCPEDGCVEALAHETLPVIGVQWHPERIRAEKTTLSGGLLLSYFASLISASAGRCC
ncbi:MAG: gamma-glutamyl-gamma-aminobutyrate hydrolase family protein [Eubacterium sp.]|nr:gamma-glutamyl-gamma-aminobutyrate hydrolase family protein [Eubacterium sp.]MCM1213408.1 gamma-glutamyl-gamma-aminobutyrate hydrolase family protein [Lachnospiraceae bacterium]MCM1305209.1 gamma-glutamyl-gamma-aminobutyrate hydrolase family protein [Butyrivibrio sp.]MCM1343505.1 gamma-glutamyl-gamma-aminobutyrate hydrolase family protein [Muribaculaceae bacterium]MCM1240686.1 gamma-glutamyl-gamma-aminobutyrate hydrolase family protein [Lachnospiraceae bacterium]